MLITIRLLFDTNVYSLPIFTEGGFPVKIVFIKETFHSDRLNKDFYVVRYALVDKDKKLVTKSQPLLWLTKEVYEMLDF